MVVSAFDLMEEGKLGEQLGVTDQRGTWLRDLGLSNWID